MTLKNESMGAGEEMTRSDEEEIPPEILAVLAAAATVFLGKSLHIRSVGLIGSNRGIGSRWTRQGRSSALASHNLRRQR
jgi:hypothetical protein